MIAKHGFISMTQAQWLFDTDFIYIPFELKRSLSIMRRYGFGIDGSNKKALVL